MWPVSSPLAKDEGYLQPTQFAPLGDSTAFAGSHGVLQPSTVMGFDIIRPIPRDLNGEDDTVQGLLKLAGIPFVGSSVLGCAVRIDQAMTKSVLSSHGIPQVAFYLVTGPNLRAGRRHVDLSRLAALSRVCRAGESRFKCGDFWSNR